MDKMRYFSRKRFSATPNWNVLLFCVFLSILGVIIATIFNRNHVRQTVGCSSSFCLHSSTATHRQSSGKDSPLCLGGNLLNKREYRYVKEARGSYDNSRLISGMGLCQLLDYTSKQAVSCFDALYSSLNLNHINSRSNKNLHFAFIGDSRIRQQFFNLLKMIPNYDRQSEPNPLPRGHHGDMKVTSDILRLRLSFQWRPILNDAVIDTIRQWGTDDQSDRPHFIVIGIAVWHMLHSEGANFKLYKEKYKKLAPFLGILANVSRVIWLNQFPVIEKYGNIDAMNTEIHSGKIHHYNEAVRSELQNYPEMRIIWDSSNLLVEEYIRGCLLVSERVQYEAYLFTLPDHSYTDCHDYTHPGYSALSQATQLLFNDICNDYIHV